MKDKKEILDGLKRHTRENEQYGCWFYNAYPAQNYCPYFTTENNKCSDELIKDSYDLLKQYDEFCCKLLSYVMGDNWDENDAEFYQEMICRGLLKLGYIKFDKNIYSKVEENNELSKYYSFCPECSRPIRKGEPYCGYCGRRLV